MLRAGDRYLHTYPCVSPANWNTVSMQIRCWDHCLGSQRSSTLIPLLLEKSPNQGTSPEWHPRTKQLCCLLHTWHHTSILLSVRCLQVTNRRGKREHNEGGGVEKKWKQHCSLGTQGNQAFHTFFAPFYSFHSSDKWDTHSTRSTLVCFLNY